ncbi:MAG: hypothetical protein ACAI25_07360 [Planctomycetota bacterium]
MALRKGLIAVALVLVSGAAARGEDKLNDLIKIFQDEAQQPPEREAALVKATNLSRALVVAKPQQTMPFREALKPLMVSLAAKRADASYEKLILAGFGGIDVFLPFQDVGGFVRPYLHAECSNDMRRAALRAIELHGAQGAGKELVQVFQEPAKKDRLRELLERAVVACTISVPTDEAQKTLTTALQTSKFKNVKRAACAGLGDLNQLRPAKEVKEKDARAALVAAASAEYPEAEVSAAACLALLRFNSFEGVAEEMKRLEAPKGDQRLAYKTICEAAHQTDGFLNLPPDRYYEAPESKKKDVLNEIKLWWGKFKTRDPDAALFEALKAAGVDVPNNTGAGSKEAITALIAGLTVPTRTLRYAALDLLVKRTGKTDLAETFRVLKSSLSGGSLSMKEWEPADGFPDPDRRDRLAAQQKQQAEVWKQWWSSVSSRAVLVDGVWVTK